MKRLNAWIQRLETHVNESWYAFVISLLSLADNFILVIPNDGILISSSLLSPKKWLRFAIAISIGSTLGGVLLAIAIKLYGYGFIDHFFPTIQQTEIWHKMDVFFTSYGLILLFFVAVSPLMQQQVVILAALSDATLLSIGLILLSGRSIKYLFLAWVSSHAPGKLKKLWGIKGELKDLDIDPNKIK